MSDEKFHSIQIDGKENVFLTLTEYAGSDFTFYLRNDNESNILNTIFKTASGEAVDPIQETTSDNVPDTTTPGDAPSPAQTSSRALEKRYQYSCHLHLLKPLLNHNDLETDPTGRRPALLRWLLAPDNHTNIADRYKALCEKLPGVVSQLSLNNLGDKGHVKALVSELNKLLLESAVAELRDKLRPTEDELQRLAAEAQRFNQIDDERAQKIIGNRLTLSVCCADAFKPLELKSGRALAALSAEGRVWSVSFREQESSAGFAPKSRAAEDNLNTIKEICEALYEEVFYTCSQSGVAGRAPCRDNSKETYQRRIDRHREETRLPEMSGLIVVAGATNSAKSLVTRGLIHLFLKNVVGPGDLERRPHLVTLEDPIEKYYAAVEIEPTSAHPQIEVELKKAREMHIDYTPRQLDSDVGNLGEALNDALRQTPKVFFVGETREKKDWRALIDFAGTGHLIVTTAHAGSLVEAMHKIFLATRAVTPADRGEVAGRLLAVIHLKRAEVVRPLRVEPNQDPFDYKVLVPALWRRVPMGLNALTAEGLASILPHSHSDENNPCSCLGRRYFARHLPELAGERLASNEAPALSKDFTDQLQLQATSWDLQGV